MGTEWKRIRIPITPMDNRQVVLPQAANAAEPCPEKLVTSYSNHKSFPTPKHTNCNTKNVIYLLECTKCKKNNQYMDQTQRPISIRIAAHRAASKLKTNLPLYKHYAGNPGHDFERDTKVTILEKATADQLTSREGHWISTMETIFPKGLNSRYEGNHNQN